MNLLTEDRLEELLKPFGDCFGPREAEGFLTSANADPEEGAEWLPYYKLAVAMNAGTIGYLCGVLTQLLSKNFMPEGMIHTALKVGRTELAASMIPCGVGPRTDVETWVRVLNKVSCVAAGGDDPLHGEQEVKGDNK